MSAVMPTAVADQAVYRDRKRYAWLLSVVAPLNDVVRVAGNGESGKSGHAVGRGSGFGI